jgi:long-chain acyl-CoA synthetase
MLIGEGRPFLSAMVVLNHEQWKKIAPDKSSNEDAVHTPEAEKRLLARIAAQMKDFPGYAQVRKIRATLEPWTVENGLLTPTLKLRRTRVLEKFHAELDEMYSGH